MQKFILLDLSRNYEIQRSDSTYISLSSGSINLINCRKYSLHISSKYKGTKEYRDYKSFFRAKLKFVNQLGFDFKANEMEYFNIRHDKIQFFNKLFFLTKIYTQINFSKIDLEILTDDVDMQEVYKSLHAGRICINLLSEKKKKNLFFYFITRRIWFWLRASVYIFVIKIFSKDKFKINKNLCLSLFPNFYNKKNKELFFHNIKQKSYINFIITDETHLNKGISSIISCLKSLRNQNLITIEKKIKFYDLFKNFLNIVKEAKVAKIITKQNFFYKKINFSYPIKDLLISSYLNRLKLKIYDRSLIDIISKTSNFHFYLFEHSFGFYILNLIKKNCPNTNLIAYQHGIFNKNLMWLDNQNYNNSKYYPDTIFSKPSSANDYKYFYHNSKIIVKTDKSQFLFDVKKKINKNHKDKYLVLLGLHDFKDILQCLILYHNKNPKKIFYIKKHPKTKINHNLYTLNKNFIFVNNLSNVKYSKVILSETSSLTQDFLNNKIPFNFFKIPYKIPILNHEYSSSIIRL